MPVETERRHEKNISQDKWAFEPIRKLGLPSTKY